MDLTTSPTSCHWSALLQLELQLRLESSPHLYKISCTSTIDDTLKCLEELENQGYLSVTAENQIQTLKFLLRHVRMQVKWDTNIDLSNTSLIIWVKYVEMCLLQPTRKGRMAADLLEETLSRMFQNEIMELVREELSSQCYYHAEWLGTYDHQFLYEDVLIDELMLEWIDPLLENLKHLIRCNDLNLLVFPKEQIEALVEKLGSLRNFLEITGTELEEVMKNLTPRQGLLHKTSEDLLTRIKMLIENVIYLSYDSWDKQEQERMKKMFYDLLDKINHVEPDIRMIYVHLLTTSKIANPGTLGIDLQALAAVVSLLDNLHNLLKDQDTGSVMPLDVNQIEFLYQELSFLKYFLMDPHLKQYTETEPQSLNSLLIKVEVMGREGASLTHSICAGQTKDDMADEMNLLHADLLQIVNLLKAEIREKCPRAPKPSTSSFPQTPKLGFLDFFLKRLHELLKHRVDSIAYVKYDIEILQSELGFLSFFVSDTIKKPEEYEYLTRRAVDVAYEAERVIDLISGSNPRSWYHMIWLSDVIQKIRMLRKYSTEVCSKKTGDISVLNEEEASIHDPSQAYTLATEEEVAGFNDEARNVIDRLTRGSKQLDIVSIVGMPGLGKTTLAKKVYEHPSVSSYFHVRSWYCISQVYERRDLLLSILGNVTELSEKNRKMDDEDMAEALYKSLKGRRYLIFIDDIWSIGPWNDIRRSFPDDCNGSRILFTSRIRDVALQANPRSAPHDLRLFSDEESWELLQNKVFKQRSCPLQLYKIGKQIAKNCKGLPLSVVVVAGILERLEENEDHWKQVSESLGKQVLGDSIKCTDVLELSYKHLPDHLKPCFLYLGAFPEDREIPTWKLIRLWIAEGFVQKTKFDSLENVAEGYLMDLIARSLVLIAQNKSSGGVKSCRLHDLLHEFSLKKAKDENFLSISKEMVNVPEKYRHSFHCKPNSLCEWMPDDPYVRSILCFPAYSSYYGAYRVDLPVHLSILKLLRVLDLERVTLECDKFPTEIELLVHLRYLAIRGEMNHVPSSVGNLWRLETFLVKGTRGEVKLPEILLEMAYLKHVYVNDRAAFELPDTFQPEKSFESEGIEKLSTPSLCCGDGKTEKVIRRLRSLRKLKCVFLESWNSDRRCNRFPVLDLLSKLESLNVTYYGIVKLPCEFSFPSNLKRLTLSKFRLPWSEISKIGRLQQLEVLKLLFNAFEGRTWDVSDDEFCNLKVLKLESLNIVEWYASPDAFPCLEQLVLQKCKQLKEVPSSFGESTTLQMIEVQWCSYSSTKAVSKIQGEQQDLRPDGLKVLFQPPDWDSAPAS